MLVRIFAAVYFSCFGCTVVASAECDYNSRNYDCNVFDSAKKPKPHYHSTAVCKNYTRSWLTSSHICRLSNVCWDPYKSTFVYYTDNKINFPWDIDSDFGPINNLRPSFLKITRHRGQYAKTAELPIIEVPGPIPRNVQFALPKVHVYYESFWAENYGHAVFDDVMPIYSLMYNFYLVTRDVQVLTYETAKNLKKQKKRSGKPNTELYLRGKKFLDEYIGYISDLVPLELKYENKTYDLTTSSVTKTSNMICYSNLLVGHSFLGLNFDSGRVIHSFLNTVVTRISTNYPSVQRAISTPLKEQLVLVLLKHGRRRIKNAKMITQYIQDVFKVRVKGIDPSKMNTRDQILLAQRATVIITPEGGISFFCIFARIHASIIIPGHYELDETKIVHMERFFWDEFEELDMIYYYPDNVTELVLERPKWRQNKPLGNGDFRDYNNIVLNVSRFLPYVEGALHKAEHTFQLPEGSYHPSIIS
jgi:hypothetical protein